jgi:hypothetical protein
MNNIIMKFNQISQVWVIGIVLIYGLLMSEYFSILSSKIIAIQAAQIMNSSIYTYLMSFSFIMILLSAFVIWLISSFLFHLFAILLGGESAFKGFLKYTGTMYIISALGFLIAIFLIGNIKIPSVHTTEFLQSSKIILLNNWIINTCSIIYYILLIPIIINLYKINWLKALGAIVIPIGSIYLLGQFFAEYVL